MIVSLLRKLSACVAIFIAIILLSHLVLMVIFSTTLTDPVTVTDPVIESLPPCESKVMYTCGGWQDFTDFGIYDFSTIDISELNNNKYFSSVNTELSNVLSYIEDFEKWVECHRRSDASQELPANYNFDEAVIDEKDYFYVKTKEGTPIGSGTYGKFDNYSLYLFDTQTKTLYYFHNNI